MAKPGKRSENACLCGRGIAYADCCGRYLEAEHPAPTAELLMRSRYTAYVLGRKDYLRQTWHPESRPTTLELDDSPNWLGLKVLRTERGRESDDEGVVEFVARFKIDGRGHRLHEISRFERIDGRWLYLDGERGPTDSSLKQ